MSSNSISFYFILCLVGVLCQKSPYVSVSKITGTGVKEKDGNVAASPKNLNNPEIHTSNSVEAKPNLVCPGQEVPIPLFPFPCNVNQDCSIMGSRMICCSNRCLRGVPLSKPEIKQVVPQIASTAANEKSTQAVAPPKNFVSTSTQIIPVKINSLVPNSNLVCPGEPVSIPLFPFPCNNNQDCSIMGSKMVCCSHRCLRGVLPSKPEIKQAVPINTNNGNHQRTEKIVTWTTSLNNSITTISPTTKANSVTQPVTVNLLHDLTQYPELICPGKETRIPFFSFPCRTNKDCAQRDPKMVCCSNRCIKGVLPPKPEIKHAPSWFGLIERQCPVDPIAEILEVKVCETDADCAPRICCPDKYRNGSGGGGSYCRTAQPSLDKFPVANRFMEPLKVFVSYMQCTPPPPPVLDLFPKSCKNTLDCFPNLCCQEGGNKYCRPPKRSLLSFVAGVGQRFVPRDAAKRLIERLN